MLRNKVKRLAVSAIFSTLVVYSANNNAYCMMCSMISKQKGKKAETEKYNNLSTQNEYKATTNSTVEILQSDAKNTVDVSTNTDDTMYNNQNCCQPLSLLNNGYQKNFDQIWNASQKNNIKSSIPVRCIESDRPKIVYLTDEEIDYLYGLKSLETDKYKKEIADTKSKLDKMNYKSRTENIRRCVFEMYKGVSRTSNARPMDKNLLKQWIQICENFIKDNPDYIPDNSNSFGQYNIETTLYNARRALETVIITTDVFKTIPKFDPSSIIFKKIDTSK